MEDVMRGVYTRDRQENSFTFYKKLTYTQKLKFVNNVTSLIVDGDSYNAILRDLIFDYEIIDMFTDIDTSYIKESNNAIDDIEDIVMNTDIVITVKKNMEDGILSELSKAVDYNIEYKTGIHDNYLQTKLIKLIDLVTEKVESYDFDEIIKVGRKLLNTNGNLTPEKVLEAFAKTDMFTKKNEKETKVVPLNVLADK